MNQPEQRREEPIVPRAYVCVKCGRLLGMRGDPPAVKIGQARMPDGGYRDVYAHKSCPEERPGLKVRWPKKGGGHADRR